LSFTLAKCGARHFLYALILALLVAPNVSNAEDIAWKTVSEDELEVIFRGEAIDLKLETAKRAWTGSLPGFVEIIRWQAANRFAIVAGWKADPGFTWDFQGSIDDKDTIESTFGLTANKVIEWGASESFHGQLGKLNIHFLKVGDGNCISWGFGYDDTSAGRPFSYSANNLVRGLYCQTETIGSEFAKRVVLLSGHKGGYEPPTEQNKMAAKPANPTGDNDRRVIAEGEWKYVPIAANWGGSGDLLIGYLNYQITSREGPFDVYMGNISCQGRWQFASGKYGTDKLPTGTWAITCSDGRSASGTYISHKLGMGTGRGTDADGKTVKITYGAN
jgi:hypothetical protein